MMLIVAAIGLCSGISKSHQNKSERLPEDILRGSDALLRRDSTDAHHKSCNESLQKGC